MAPTARPEDDRLIAAYQEAALRIQRALQTYQSPSDRVRIMRTIESLLQQLDDLSAKYVSEQLPLHFKDGSEEAVAFLRGFDGLQIDTTFGTLHREAIQQLAADASLKFANALAGVRMSSVAKLTTLDKQFVMNKLISEELAGSSNPSAAVKEAFTQQGIIAFRGKRDYTLEEYSALLTHNVLADAHNTGAATRYLSNGVEFARRIERADCCKICQPLRDKIVSLKDRRLWPPSHPFCYGGLTPILGKPTEEPIMSPNDPRLPTLTQEYLLKKP